MQFIDKKIGGSGKKEPFKALIAAVKSERIPVSDAFHVLNELERIIALIDRIQENRDAWRENREILQRAFDQLNNELKNSYPKEYQENVTTRSSTASP